MREALIIPNFRSMKALVKSKAEKGIWMEDVPIPVTGPNDVLIKVSKSSICGTDLHIYNWDEWAQKTIPVGLTIGHEYAGHVAQVGSEVSEFQEGDRVTGEGTYPADTAGIAGVEDSISARQP